MALTPEQREQALAILERSGGALPLFNFTLPENTSTMTPAEIEHLSEQLSQRAEKYIDTFLENVYEQALVKHTLAHMNIEDTYPDPPDDATETHADGYHDADNTATTTHTDEPS